MLPALPKHGGDRNRTSPFAFTGNKFEFRALGSSQSLALPNTVLNTIVAEAIDELADSSRAAGGGRGRRARRSCATPTPPTSRSSSTATTTPTSGTRRPRSAASTTSSRPRTRCRGSSTSRPIEVFSRYEVLSERELEARYEVMVEQYVTNLNIEAETAADLARTMLLPAALQYMALLDDADGGKGVERLEKEIAGSSTSSSSRSTRSRRPTSATPRPRTSSRAPSTCSRR